MSKKEWIPEKPANASATFRLFSYTGTDVSKAKMVEDMDLPRDANSARPPLSDEEQWTAVFDHLPTVNDQDVPLNYLVKEISGTPGYEPSYTGNTSYTVNDGTVTNKPAKTDFSVTVQWERLSGDEWPKDIILKLPLRRRPKGTTTTDPNFMMNLSLPGSGTDEEFEQRNEADGADPQVRFRTQRIRVQSRPYH